MTVSLSRGRASRICLSAVLLFAFLPTLTFLGHWEEIFLGGAPTPSQVSMASAVIFDLNAVRADQARHAQHCHTNLGTCTEQPMPAGVGLFVTREALLPPPPVALGVRIVDVATALVSPAISPLLPPPRAA